MTPGGTYKATVTVSWDITAGPRSALLIICRDVLRLVAALAQDERSVTTSGRCIVRGASPAAVGDDPW